ncbi:hypothetical protein NDU88_000126 [Pleurodeles waltl]|uniref:Uncharacterized protein n=1 Tax=Pleurodeles waltl TaxID=8319 RepID=A0AAV7TE08_PLEWA|nr:hypothetical protein NDU88_000126 [Pleurodeles waltl]
MGDIYSLCYSGAGGRACSSSRRNGREAASSLDSRTRLLPRSWASLNAVHRRSPGVLCSGSLHGIGGPGNWAAPRGLPNWVPPVLRRADHLVEETRLRPLCRPFFSETRCRPAGSRRPVVGVRVGSSVVVEGFRRGLRQFPAYAGPPPPPRDRYGAELGT